ASAALAAGCDVILHCNGDLAEMEAITGAAPRLSGQAALRAERAEQARILPDATDIAAASEHYARLTGEVPIA
ncbi:MAG TPA: beta-hexosaminidase, partial [Paracoccaceae bacterium]|nr:beta-hexosaminidase [Paracoccaceae bacterium]